MYSWEIQQTLEAQNYSINSETYENILNTSPQICHVKYDPYENSYEAHTNNNEHWKFNVYLKL